MQDRNSAEDERPPEERDGSEADPDPEAGVREQLGELLDLEGEEADRLSDEIREALEELEELRGRHLRLAAEFENYRKRTRRELSEAGEKGRADLAERLLDALDDLERLREGVIEGAEQETLEEGILMLHRKLLKELGEAGLSRMEPEGEPFDPRVHEALLTTPTGAREENNRVARVLIDGYTFGDRVVRPARVEVKKYRAPGAAADGSASGGGVPGGEAPGDGDPDES